ncbi:hypothetical protein ABH935_000883 [Catenulispora sp. GAS73]|uniref:hypothetical protein n=1 Tax=Catenulispora sp. GAS73 TaxID=3156269 RepID=UPI003514E188
MDARTRKAVAARDRAVGRVSHLTWRIGSFAAVGAVVLGAGFAHLLPTHLPHFSSNGGSGNSGSSGTSGSNSGSTNIQGPGTAPQQGSGSGSHVTSGGS